MENRNSSSISSVTEYVNTLNEVSELENSTANSVNIQWDSKSTDKGHLTVSNEHSMDIMGNSDSQDSSTLRRTKFRNMYLAALAVLINAFCMGFGATYPATAVVNMRARKDSIINPENSEVGWIGSFMPLGALFGGMVAGHLSQKLGRKGALILSTFPFVIGWLSIALAASIPYIYVGRFVVGFCCGLVSVTTPTYLVEISTPEVRGLLGASFQLFVTIGILAVSCLGSIMPWEWLAMSGALLSIITLLGMIAIPESPRWLMTKGRTDEAIDAIKLLQGDFLDPIQCCKEIQEDIDNEPNRKTSPLELFHRKSYKQTLLSYGLMIFQQCSGVNAILFYSGDIFTKAGSFSANVATVIVSIVQALATLVSSILMDKAGRKALLLISGCFMAISLAIFGGFDFVAVGNPVTENTIRHHYGWIPLLCVVVFISAFSIGFGPIPWLMVNEMTTGRLRSLTGGTATAMNWTIVFAVTTSFHVLAEAMHDYGVFWIYAAFCIGSCFFTFFLLPETKGKTLEEIQEHFAQKSDQVELTPNIREKGNA